MKKLTYHERVMLYVLVNKAASDGDIKYSDAAELNTTIFRMGEEAAPEFRFGFELGAL